MGLSVKETFEWILRRPLLVIFATAVITIYFGWQLPNLSFKTSVYDLQIEDLPETARYNDFKKLFGSDEIIRVVIKSSNVFDPITFRKIELLDETAAKIEGVRRVISLPGIKKAVDVAGDWSMEKFYAMVSKAELFRKNLISTDGKTTALTLALKSGADSQRVVQRVRQMLQDAPADLKLYQTGMPLVSEALARYREGFFPVTPDYFFDHRRHPFLSVPQTAIHRRTAHLCGAGPGLDIRPHGVSQNTSFNADDDCAGFSGGCRDGLLSAYRVRVPGQYQSGGFSF